MLFFAKLDIPEAIFFEFDEKKQQKFFEIFEKLQVSNAKTKVTLKKKKVANKLFRNIKCGQKKKKKKFNFFLKNYKCQMKN